MVNEETRKREYNATTNVVHSHRQRDGQETRTNGERNFFDIFLYLARICEDSDKCHKRGHMYSVHTKFG